MENINLNSYWNEFVLKALHIILRNRCLSFSSKSTPNEYLSLILPEFEEIVNAYRRVHKAPSNSSDSRVVLDIYAELPGKNGPTKFLLERWKLVFDMKSNTGGHSNLNQQLSLAQKKAFVMMRSLHSLVLLSPVSNLFWKAKTTQNHLIKYCVANNEATSGCSFEVGAEKQHLDFSDIVFSSNMAFKVGVQYRKNVDVDKLLAETKVVMSINHDYVNMLKMSSNGEFQPSTSVSASINIAPQLKEIDPAQFSNTPPFAKDVPNLSPPIPHPSPVSPPFDPEYEEQFGSSWKNKQFRLSFSPLKDSPISIARSRSSSNADVNASAVSLERPDSNSMHLAQYYSETPVESNPQVLDVVPLFLQENPDGIADSGEYMADYIDLAFAPEKEEESQSFWYLLEHAPKIKAFSEFKAPPVALISLEKDLNDLIEYGRKEFGLGK